MKRKVVFGTLICFVFLIFHSAAPAMAQDADLVGLIKSLQKQMADLQATVSAQNAELQDLKSRQADIKMASGGVERNQPTPPMSEAEFKQRLGDATGGADKWLKDLKFSGDVRLRYEAFHLHGNPNANPSSTTSGYQDARNRFRVRLRYGFEKKFNDEMKAGFSMASGDKTSGGYNTDPISTNQTMTNDFNFKNIWIEKVYATYTPDWSKMSFSDNGGLRSDGLEITAGKFNNPFEKGSTDMIWDRDLKPEGIYEKIDGQLLKTDNLTLKSYGLLMQSVLMETGNSSATFSNKDANLFAYQAGLNPIFYVPGLDRPVDALSAISVYNFQNYANSGNWTVSTASQANGNPSYDANTLSARNFNILSFYQEVNFYPYGIPVKPFAEFAHNMSNQSGLSLATPNNSMQGSADAWSMGLTLGKLQKKGDWQTSYQYKYIGANSVVGAFNDSDFGGYNYGGTDKSGSVVKLGYNLTDYLTLNGACYLVRPITVRDTTVNGMQVDQSVRRFQVDVTYKF
ncbi:MAG TPA: putative porin [Candidatus Omnitrophota bacterium]|nr:putative porin [Candidatus Omnitrophota bacterium]HPS36957.1 putative porin [Candidatus Omnitrophota bacterium]